MPTIWDILKDAGIPVVAILLSTGIAIWLARRERKDATAARERDSIERVLEQLMELYAFFISANPYAEAWSPAYRTMRARISILQTIPAARTLADWLIADYPRGQQAMTYLMANSYPQMDPVEMVELMRPMADWASESINTIGLWLRGDLTDDDLRVALQRLTKQPPA